MEWTPLMLVRVDLIRVNWFKIEFGAWRSNDSQLSLRRGKTDKKIMIDLIKAQIGSASWILWYFTR